jgi:hypothetical protein
MFHLTPEKKEILDLETKIFNSEHRNNANIWSNKKYNYVLPKWKEGLNESGLANSQDFSILIGQGWQFLIPDMRLSTPQSSYKQIRTINRTRVTKLHKFLWTLKDS